MRENEIVVFRYRKGVRTGRYIESERDKVRVATDKERSFSVPRTNILFPTEVVAESQGQLEAFQKQTECLGRQIDLDEVWDLVREDREALSFRDLAELYWDTGPDSTKYAAMLCHLEGESCPYFQPKGDLYLPAREEEVEATRNRLRRQREQAAEEKAFLSWLGGKESQLSVEAMSARQRAWLERLTAFIVEGDEYAQSAWVSSLLARQGKGSRDPRRHAFRLLVERGIFQPDEHLALRRLEVPRGFSEEAEREAAEFDPRSEAVRTQRQDLRDLVVLSIDDESTRDVDDAFSLQRPGDGYRVGIHITDLSEAVPPDSPLDEIARQRVLSLYFPESTIPMLPAALSAESGSLVAGEERLALTLLADFDASLHFQTAELVLSTIVNHHRLTYDTADAILCGEDHVVAETVRTLSRIAETLQRRRIEAGALELERPELDIKVNEIGEIDVEVRARETPANRLVTELMILYNVEVARFCHARELPVIYRAQDPIAEPPENGDVAVLPEPVRRFRLLKRIAPAKLTIEPRAHHLLGVDLYCQASSPLRRYGDLILQRQIVSWLRRGEAVHSRDEITAIIHQTDERARELSRLENDRARYWFLKYLTGYKGKRFLGVLLDVRGREGLLELDRYSFRAPVSLGTSVLAPGESIQAELVHVDPWDGALRFALRDG